MQIHHVVGLQRSSQSATAYFVHYKYTFGCGHGLVAMSQEVNLVAIHYPKPDKIEEVSRPSLVDDGITLFRHSQEQPD